ncbi:molybdopterin-guanine dinucleotide biosynthesis protein B [Balnearium lithotrophicum]|uniref:Molybdopterin-guanine dinucleotide biosynthesis protein B n=1 Tax=Balnearium lithotrophicum TaxID=223788 RepID=A0A521BG71_9BACT|nr:molybdopterin-guanine dinucleotide biosynthesis protein B [Balnearium lithotrophicum]SMO46107.1 molybdopterin-guanine dinucleotide biosynthesis protein B [Balnearium lithotrophicum]
MVPVVSFIGYHNSGKTTFATEVVKILKERGYKVGVLKSTKHRQLITDTPGKDSFKYREAGADAVGIVSPDELVLFQDIDRDSLDLNFLSFLLFGEYDIVVCEGFKNADVPKIEVLKKENSEKPLFKKVENVIAVISDFPVEEGIRRFNRNDYDKVAKFLIENFIEKGTEGFENEVELFINGKKIPIKYYDGETLREILNSFIKPLKGIEYPVKRMDVRIVRGKGRRS